MNKLLHVIRSADPLGGGPIEVVKRLAVEHINRGRQVEVVTLDPPNSPWLQDLPFPTHALGPVSTKYGYSRRLLPWLRAHASDFDWVIVNGLWQYTGFAVWRALRHSSTPYVVFPHGMLDPWFKRRYPLKHAKKWLYWPWAEYRVLRDARAVLFTSEDERRMARESFWLYSCHEEVINYGTAPPPEETAGERARFLERFPELQGKRVVLFLGRIHEKKGCELLINGFAKARRAAPPSPQPWHLVMAGPPATASYQRRLERLVIAHDLSEHVTWIGMLSGESKWAALRLSDVFALPSHQENFGVAVVEALACSVPVLISTKVNIWREILAEGAGIAEADDQNGTDQLLARWMSLPPATQLRMREKARLCFTNRFDVRDTATRLAVIFEKIA